MNEFIRRLTEQMRCVKAREGVAREVSDHILDQAAAYEETGMEHDKAVEMAVHEMGDPVEIGVSLDRIHRPQMNWKLILVTFVLTMAGLFVMYSIYGMSTIVSRQCVFAAAGMAVILAVNFIAYILLTAAFFICGMTLQRVNGRIPALAVLVYLYVPVFAGILYRLRGGRYGAVGVGMGLVFLTSCLAARFGSSVIIGLNIFLILLVTLLLAVRKGMFRIRQRGTAFVIAALGMLPVLVPALALCFMEGGFRKERILAFLHRGEYNQSAGYIYTAIDTILGSSHFVGKGNETVYALSDYGSNLVLLRLMHEYGLIAGIVLLLLFVVFAVGVMKIVQSQKNQLGMLVSASCFLVFAANCLEGILVNLGLLPMTTVSIPFVTFGGSVALVYSVLIGLILSVHRYEKVLPLGAQEQRARWHLHVKLEKE